MTTTTPAPADDIDYSEPESSFRAADVDGMRRQRSQPSTKSTKPARLSKLAFETAMGNTARGRR